MKQNIVDVFDRTNQNLIIVQDENGNSFGLQKINRKRKSLRQQTLKLLITIYITSSQLNLVIANTKQ